MLAAAFLSWQHNVYKLVAHAVAPKARRRVSIEKYNIKTNRINWNILKAFKGYPRSLVLCLMCPVEITQPGAILTNIQSVFSA